MEYIFTFPNTHNAIYGEKVLKEKGLDVSIMPLPGQIGQGCGFCLRVKEEDFIMAKGHLIDADVDILSSYRKEEDGKTFTEFK